MRPATALVTGATSGVGKAIAERLAASGTQVLAHGSKVADFSALAEVRRFGQQILATHERLDLLINNAGIGFGPPGAPREESCDRHERRLAVNYLAPFLLTHLLLPLLRRSAPARIVNVASLGQAPVDFEDVMLTRAYDGPRAYGQSKLALIMFTFDLATMLQGSGVTANAIHPATLMPTRMVAESGLAPASTIDEGAEAVMHLATSPTLDATSGEFFDGHRVVRALPMAYDARARQRLRSLTLELTGLG